MSAQAGIFNFDGEPADKGLIEKLTATYRQDSDSARAHYSGPMGLLYCAFSTTPESCVEHQPHLSDRGFAITWDGRLDNREELICQLNQTPSSLRTDVAITAAAFERWGTGCFQRLIGDWALCVSDPINRTLILARDYIGIRHLHYYVTEKSVIWCTDLAPLVLLPGVSFTVNEEYIAGYLASYPDTSGTPYQEIRRVPPGHFVRIEPEKLIIDRFWNLNPEQQTRYKTDGEYEDRFRFLFRQSVHRRLRSCSPIVAELSGGLDSSSIVCMADEILAQDCAGTPRLDTLSRFDPTEPGNDERPYFTKVEQKRGRSGHHLDVSKYQPSISIDWDIFYPTPESIRSLNRLAADTGRLMEQKGYRVVLSGIGGDEFLGGEPDPSWQLADLILQLRFRELTKALVDWSLVKRRPWLHLLFQALVRLIPYPIAARLTVQGEMAPWINQRFARRQSLRVRQLGPREELAFRLPSQRNLVRTVLVLARQMSCTSRLPFGRQEVWYPYLDRDLVEFLVSIPETQLLRPGERRSLMRRALGNLLPPEILHRSTKAVRLRRNMVAVDSGWSELEALFKSPLGQSLGYLLTEPFRQSLRLARNGKAPQMARLLRTISLELWLRNLAIRGLIQVPSYDADFLEVETPCLGGPVDLNARSN